MKKGVLLMAGLMAVALAGSAQAAGNTMFAVQSSGGVDQAIITDVGDVTANGSLTVGGKYAGGLSNAPTGPSPTFTPLAGPLGIFHVAGKGAALANAAFLAQFVTTGAGSYPAGVGPNFSFYRVNQNTTDSSYVLPLTDNVLGMFNFGTINYMVDPNSGAGRKNTAMFAIRAESPWSATGTAIDVTPTYFVWLSTPNGGVVTEKMRLTSAGTLKIANGSADTTTSKLNITGLPQSLDEVTVPAGLVKGDLWRTATNVIKIVP
jgi:hypothetical protein